VYKKISSKEERERKKMRERREEKLSKIMLEFLAADAKCNAVSPATLHIVTSEQYSKICLSITIIGPAHARSNKVLPALSTTCGSALWRHNISIAISLPMAIAAAAIVIHKIYMQFSGQ
jgi:hypothetical protein